MGPTSQTEPIIEPDLPIVDSQHHLWYTKREVLAELTASLSPGNPVLDFLKLSSWHRYLHDEYFADVNTGHNIVATVFCKSATMHRQDGTAEMKSLGEVEYAVGV